MTFKYKLRDGQEIETQISIPREYEAMIEDLRLLKKDGQNPNKMTTKQKDSVWKSLQKFSWFYPIVADKDGTFADGEQRVDTCIERGEFYGPVLRLNLTDVDRRLLRQVANKLKGKHDKLLDAQEFDRIRLAESEAELKALLNISNTTLNRYEQILDTAESQQGARLDSTFEVVVCCKDEREQQAVYEKLVSEGYVCRILTL